MGRAFKGMPLYCWFLNYDLLYGSVVEHFNYFPWVDKPRSKEICSQIITKLNRDELI